MESSDYIIQLKRKQLNLLKDYQSFLDKHLSRDTVLGKNYYSSFREKEKSYLNRLEHLNHVIAAFPNTPEEFLDRDLKTTYTNVKNLLDKLILQLNQKKNELNIKEKAFLLRDNRQKRLYRDLKPAYIDIRT